MEQCQKCSKVDNNYLYALENRGIIYKWVCERCFFVWMKGKKRKEQGKKEMVSY